MADEQQSQCQPSGVQSGSTCATMARYRLIEAFVPVKYRGPRFGRATPTERNCPRRGSRRASGCGTQRARIQRVPVPELTPQSVLVVDDFSDMRELYQQFLGLHGFHVVQAADGREALSVAQQVHPAAIVMDLEMPTMGGSEAARALKRDQRTKDIPILVLTGTSRENQLADARAAGCAALLRKPCMPEVLLEAIHCVLRGEPVPNDLALP